MVRWLHADSTLSPLILPSTSTHNTSTHLLGHKRPFPTTSQPQSFDYSLPRSSSVTYDHSLYKFLSLLTIPSSLLAVYWLFPIRACTRSHTTIPVTNKSSSVYWLFPSTTKSSVYWLFPIQTRSVTYDHSLHKPDTSLARSSSFLLPRMSAAVDSWHDEWNIYIKQK